MAIQLTTDSIIQLIELIKERSIDRSFPYIVSIDGRSGVGKSTLGHKLAALLDGIVIEGDDFFSGGVTVRSDSPKERAENCIDLVRLREALMQLRNNEVATYFAYDWKEFDNSLSHTPSIVEPKPIIIIDGVYTGSPILSDVIDLRLLLRVPDELRLQRLLTREGSIGPWEAQWHEAEEYYFYNVARPSLFDVIIDDQFNDSY